MPIILVAVAVLGAILFWVLRAHGTVKQLQNIDSDTKGLQRRVKGALQDLVGSPLSRVRDVRLAATILMIQIVRTGSPVAAAEKTKILELMEDPLAIENLSASFERAWGYTQARRPFSLVMDELLPLLRDRLSEAEQLQLVDMLTRVAGAHSAPSELQREALVRLRRRLTGKAPALRTNRSGDFA